MQQDKKRNDDFYFNFRKNTLIQHFKRSHKGNIFYHRKEKNTSKEKNYCFYTRQKNKWKLVVELIFYFSSSFFDKPFCIFFFSFPIFSKTFLTRKMKKFLSILKERHKEKILGINSKDREQTQNEFEQIKRRKIVGELWKNKSNESYIFFQTNLTTKLKHFYCLILFCFEWSLVIR